MEQLRVLWLKDGQCVLFNSLSKRISNICPEIVGKVAVRVSHSEDLGVVLSEENITYPMDRKISDLLKYMKGGEVASGTLGIRMDDRRFNRLLALAPSTVCNLQCVYCSGESEKTSKYMMDWNLAKTAIDYFFEHCPDTGPYTLQFHGAGEPMVNSDIVFASLAYAREITESRGQKLFSRITTNGVFPKDMAVKVAESFDHVTLSLDGMPQIHDFQRPLKSGHGSYQNVVDTMRILEAHGVLKRINTVVTSDGLNRMDEILHHIRSVSNVKQLRILPMEFCGRCNNSYIEPLDMEGFNREFMKILPMADALGFEIMSVIEQASYYTDHYCGACGFNMCVTADGYISTCIEAMDISSKEANDLFIGEYKNGQIVIDWDKVFFLRSRTHRNLAQCKDCVFRTNCSGSCLIRAARKNGTVMSVDDDSCQRVKTVLTKHFSDMAKAFPQKSEEITFKSLVDASLDISKRFDEVNSRDWSVEVLMIELMKQVGDLSKRFMTRENYYFAGRSTHPDYNAANDLIANELADIFHSIIRIADYYDIDLAQAFLKARSDELGYITEHMNGK